jgi:pSer/pThr/pTyr-binding forkhead associated (FHA) protein
MSGTIFLALRILLTISLYAFLILALMLLWRTVKQQGQVLTFRRTPPITISLQQPELPIETKRYMQPEVVIGRDPSCECSVNHETVSARHARLSYHHGQWWLEDLKSKNGTRLNRERLETPAVVVNGDEIGCGNITLIIHLADRLKLSSNGLKD